MATKPPRPKPKLSQLSAADRAKRVAALVKNPGTRASVPTAYLPPEMRKKRELNARLAAPIVPGSTTTQRDLARSANAATTVKYAPAEQALGAELGQAQGLQRDTPGWYDNYLRERATHAQNVQGFGTDANTAAANLQAGTKGLDQANLDAQRNQSNADAASRGATPADLGVAASNGAAVRQAILAAVGTQVADSGRAANTYADTLAHVVAPTEKLSAVTQAAGKVGAVREKQTALKTEEGAYNTSFRQQTTADEAKNVLAQQIAGVGAAKAVTTATNAAGGGGKQYGYTPAEWLALTPAQRTQIVKDAKPKPKAPGAPTGYKAGGPGLNKYGYTYDQWTAMSPKAQANARAGKDKPKKPTDPASQYAKDFYAKYGVQPAATAAVGSAKNSIQSAASLVRQIRQSNPGLTRQQIGQLLLNGQAGSSKKGQESLAIPKQKGLWATVALDLWQYKGKISAGTANKLHHAGYSVKLLGLNTVPATGSSTYASPPGPATTGSRGDSPS